MTASSLSQKKSERSEKKKKLLPQKFTSVFSENVTSERVSQIIIQNEADTLEELFNAASNAGKLLKEKLDSHSLKEYRSSVKAFLSFIVNKNIAVDSEEGRIDFKNGSRKKYLIIKIVDEKLDALSRLFFSEQRDNLEILNRIGEINGLLVNFMK